MSVQNLSWAFAQNPRDHLAKLMLVTLANEGGDETFFRRHPRNLAREFDCHPIAALRALYRLDEIGAITLQILHEDGSVEFHFNLPEADDQP